MTLEFAEIIWAGRRVRIEHQWISAADPAAPIILFLHEGLGSLSMWRDFPQKLCAATGCRGLVYSRPGYGRSTPRAIDESWGPDFMHRQAREVLPAFLRAVGLDPDRSPLWLFGHSDGGSISLLYAAAFPEALAGAIVMAPHILVEDLTITNIVKARDAYLTTDLPKKLGRYHESPDSAFWGWNDIWLDPRFKDWSIESELSSIRCPLLAVQGVDDEYGTLEQIHGIKRRVATAESLELPACGHSPHRDQPDLLIAATATFLRKRTF